jgi:hypothetical protein
LNNFKAQTIIMQVTDVFGRTMFTKSVNLKTGNSSVSIDTDKWGRQVYILRVTNAKNEVLSLQKFVKQ